jgi:hypothetical protein
MTSPAYISLSAALAITGHTKTQSLARWVERHNEKMNKQGRPDRLIRRHWGKVHTESLRREFEAGATQSPAFRVAEAAERMGRRRRG